MISNLASEHLRAGVKEGNAQGRGHTTGSCTVIARLHSSLSTCDSRYSRLSKSLQKTCDAVISFFSNRTLDSWRTGWVRSQESTDPQQNLGLPIALGAPHKTRPLLIIWAKFDYWVAFCLTLASLRILTVNCKNGGKYHTRALSKLVDCR